MTETTFKDRRRWFYSPVHQQLCQIIETQSIWGETVCRVWLPRGDSVVRIPASHLKPVENAAYNSPDHISYIAAAARIADSLTDDVLLAPIESAVIPLPHQIRALSRAIANDRVRYLLADEVGLGKTIEAGLILRELKLRGMVQRTLVVAPKGLLSQWVGEMRFHFNETFQLVLPEDIKTLKRIAPEPSPGGPSPSFPHGDPPHANAWRMFSQVVAPMDSVKPMDKRKGWTQAQIADYNQDRFEDLISAGWDLIIVDEAHRLGGSTDQVARFKLGQGLSEAAPYLLLLSATPHQGKTDAFHRLVSLIDAHAFPDISSVTRERVQPYVIRTEKRRAIDAEGNPLFKPRRTQLETVSWEDRHAEQQLLYEAVTEYVRKGYNQAVREKRNYIGFLMILMQRLVVSSTRAIRTTLERRLAALAAPQAQLPLPLTVNEEELTDLDGQEQMELLLRTHLKALKNERAEVTLLLEAAARCEQTGPDAKAESLLTCLYRLQSEEDDPELKVLVFTEFVPTQEMLRKFLMDRGFSVVCLNGSMGMEERQGVQEAFAGDVRILISTDAGGEGLNLQFCHVVINYDIPWNPMRLEQRIGRVDRIGQAHPVRAMNFVFEESVEHRVREVLEQKLAVIFEEFGIDKTGDVLDSAEGGRMFDDMYVEAILNPDQVETSVEDMVARLKDQVREARATTAVLGSTDDLEPGEAQRLLTHPLPHWIEQMTVSYLRSHGGRAERTRRGWDLHWPDGKTDKAVVFSAKEADKFPASKRMTLEEPRIRGLTMGLSRFVPGQPIPSVSVTGLSDEIRGIWSLWRIGIAAMAWDSIKRESIMALFLADNGKIFSPTARRIWDQLLAATPALADNLGVEDSRRAFDQLQQAAEAHGKPIYETILQQHLARIETEREKTAYAFASRRRAIERLGLPQVRNYRLNLLSREERSIRERLNRQADVFPRMTPLIMIRVEGTP